ncbi:MAG: alkaline phosphatase family protein, partial [Bacteroidetes bacterium]|nr:alkaline phosphatase family protein [Bacteroidota bacterium]
GTRTEGLISAFPTKTFPNHYTIVTGLYPEHHGIIANNMYDPVFDASFSLGNREAVSDGRWWGGEPIWVTAQQQGLRSATLFWPGSEAVIQGHRPTYWLPYDGDMPGAARVAQVLDWLDRPADERPSFLTLYFSRVDSKGHWYGPDSDSTAQAIAEVDRYLGMLVDGLEARDLLGRMHLLVVSDHGMIATSSERVILLDDYIDLDDVQVVDWNPVVMLRPEPGREDSVYAALRQAPHLTVHRKSEMPDRLHFDAHRRIPPIIGIADEGWVITTRARYEERPERYDGGTHGYDPQLRSMHGLFLGHGPAFDAGAVVEPFENVHLYNLMADLLDLRPAPNDGDATVARRLLRSPDAALTP